MEWICETCEHVNIDDIQNCHKCHAMRQPAQGGDTVAKRKSNSLNDTEDTSKATLRKKQCLISSLVSPKNVSSFSSSAKRGPKGKRSTSTASGHNDKTENTIKSFILKNPSEEGASSTSSSKRTKKPSLKPRREKDMTQMSILQVFKLKSNETSETAREEERKKFLEQESPDPTATSTHQRVTEIQFLRDRLSVVAAIMQPIEKAEEISSLQPIEELLNDEQLRAAVAPPDIPLSIRAGAGSGKTHTMVQRARYLVDNYKLDPEKILIVTFSRRAANELDERIAAVFASMHKDESTENTYPMLPTVKTFHGLAFNWVRMYRKACGLGKHPTILSKSQQQSLMKDAIIKHLDKLRLERCQRRLWKSDELPEEITWDGVLARCQERHNEIFKNAEVKAHQRADEKIDKKKTKLQTAEESQALKAEMKAAKKLYLREECYLALLRKQDCDLERRWTGDRNQCQLYLELIRKAKMHNHSKNDYPQDDACVWDLYESLQRDTGQLDFDMLLAMFTEKVLQIENIRSRFHAMYSHVIVDEFQDNSEQQADMLRKIVKGGSLTVVGDDDQCSKSAILLMMTF